MVLPEKVGLHAQMHSQSPDNQSTAYIFNGALRPSGTCCMLTNMQITLIIPVANRVPEWNCALSFMYSQHWQQRITFITCKKKKKTCLQHRTLVQCYRDRCFLSFLIFFVMPSGRRYKVPKYLLYWHSVCIIVFFYEKQKENFHIGGE